MKALIAGAGRLGTQIAQVLAAAHNDVTLLDRDDERITELEDRLPVRLVGGDAGEPAVLEHSGARTADLVIAAVVREGQPTVPTPEMRLQPGDELLVVSHAATEQEIHAAFQ